MAIISEDWVNDTLPEVEAKIWARVIVVALAVLMTLGVSLILMWGVHENGVVHFVDGFVLACILVDRMRVIRTTILPGRNAPEDVHLCRPCGGRQNIPNTLTAFIISTIFWRTRPCVVVWVTGIFIKMSVLLLTR